MQENMVSNTKEKTIGTYLKPVDSLMKPVILYACECWGDSMKEEIFAYKIEQFHMSTCKQILGVTKYQQYQGFIRIRKSTA